MRRQASARVSAGGLGDGSTGSCATGEITKDRLIVDLADDRSLTVPLAWFPRLALGTTAERRSGGSLAGARATALCCLEDGRLTRHYLAPPKGGYRRGP
jgi:hypothetical protein